MGRPLKTTKQCEKCGESFHPWKAEQIYCSRGCYFQANSGPGNYLWKGETWFGGRCFVSIPGESRRVHRSRLVMEEKLGRSLLPGEVVHHKNLDKSDDSPDNLELKQTQAKHAKAHAKTFRNETHKQCTRCRQIKSRSLFDAGQKRTPEQDPQHTQCKECRSAYYAERWRKGLTSQQRK